MDRVRIKEIKRNSVVAEIFQKHDHNKTYFDVRYLREFISEGQKKRGPYIQQRDVRDIIIVSGLVQEWIADKHRNLRENQISYENDSVPYEVDEQDDYENSSSFEYAEE